MARPIVVPFLLCGIPCGLAAILRLVHMGGPQQGYYTATVVSMLQSLHNFLYASFDPGGLVMVDKPPVAFWVQALAVALLGPTEWAVALPQCLAGVVSVSVLYALLRRDFGPVAATTGGLILAVFPAAIWVDTRNETDGLLAFFLLLAAAALLQAGRTGRLRWVTAAAALLGLAFNTKMLMALVPVPAFGLFYLVVARVSPPALGRRVALGLAVLLVTSVSWPAMVEMTPPDSRPYVGSTDDNSILTLIVGHNGVQRFTSFIGPLRPPGIASPGVARFPDPGQNPAGPPAEGLNLFDMRMLFTGRLAAVTGWLLAPGLALLALVCLAGVWRRVRADSAVDGADSTVPPAVLLWGGWLLTATFVFGFARATVSHPYYLAALGAPLAAVTGIGVGALWDGVRRKRRWVMLASASLAPIVAGYETWQATGLPDLARFGLPAAAAGAIAGAVLVASRPAVRWRRVALVNAAVGTASLLLVPAALALGGVAGLPGTGSRGPSGAAQVRAPQAQALAGLPGEMRREAVDRLIAYMASHAGQGTRYGLVAMSAASVAPFIIAGVPAAALGGFGGRDPVLTPEAFEDMAVRGEVHYFLTGGTGPGANFRPLVPQAGPPRPRPGPAASPGARLSPDGTPAGAEGRPTRGPRANPIEVSVWETWRDVSDDAGLPAGTFFQYPGS